MFIHWRRFLGKQASIRDRLWPLRDTVADLFNCPYCLGVWVAGLLYILRKPLKPIIHIFAIAGVQSLLQMVDDVLIEKEEN